MEYLSFELPIKELMDQYQTCSLVGEESGVDVKLACSQIEDKILEKKKEIYGNLTPWQRVQLSRHPDRPYTLDYINGMADKGMIYRRDIQAGKLPAGMYICRLQI